MGRYAESYGGGMKTHQMTLEMHVMNIKGIVGSRMTRASRGNERKTLGYLHDVFEAELALQFCSARHRHWRERDAWTVVHSVRHRGSAGRGEQM